MNQMQIKKQFKNTNPWTIKKAAKKDFIALKADKLYINKLVNVPTSLNDLKTIKQTQIIQMLIN